MMNLDSKQNHECLEFDFINHSQPFKVKSSRFILSWTAVNIYSD